MKTLQIIIDIFTYTICAVIMIIGIVLINNRLSDSQNQTITFNCSIAEISPDFTPAMREMCRKLRREQR
jgi:hypothetical protein